MAQQCRRNVSVASLLRMDAGRVPGRLILSEVSLEPLSPYHPHHDQRRNRRHDHVEHPRLALGTEPARCIGRRGRERRRKVHAAADEQPHGEVFRRIVGPVRPRFGISQRFKASVRLLSRQRNGGGV